MKARKKKGLSPGVALLLLAAAGGVFAFNVMPMLGNRAAAPNAPPGATQHDGVAAPVATATLEGGQAEWHDADLLARYGVFVVGSPVRAAFGLARASEADAAPVAETRPVGVPAADGWQGADPTPLRVAFVMIGGPVARAVVDGVVVGVGDLVSGGKITAIERQGIVVASGERVLHYGLAGTWPSEFRAEQLRRQSTARQKAASPGNEQEKGR